MEAPDTGIAPQKFTLIVGVSPEGSPYCVFDPETTQSVTLEQMALMKCFLDQQWQLNSLGMFLPQIMAMQQQQQAMARGPKLAVPGQNLPPAALKDLMRGR